MIDRSKVIEIIIDACGVQGDNLTDETPIGDAGIDSITFIQIVVKIERELGIELDDEYLELSNFKVLGDLFKVLEESSESDQ